MAVTDQPAVALVVAYGTDMGNAEDAAMSFAEAAQAAGFDAEAVELNQLELSQLRSATHFVVATSTFGDGEFPDNATLFWEALSASSERLEHLSFAVLALGDTSYELFCNAGKLLDERLEALGATRLVERVDVDGSYLKQATTWTADVMKLLTAEKACSASVVEMDAAVAEVMPSPVRDRHGEFETRLTANRILTSSDSDKEVRHFEVALAGSGIAYHAGDSLAVRATNDPALVDALMAALGACRDDTVADHEEPLGVLLSEHFEIRTPSRALQSLVARKARDASMADALSAEGASGPDSWIYGKDVLDLVRLADLTVEEVLDTLRPLQFRDYSIASSPLVHPDSAHLTVAVVRYTVDGRERGGVASTFLADRCETLRVHLRPNHTFRLPADDVPIIMIGPGTGIAPFRAFLQERQATRAPGKSWLFFGDRRRLSSYLYGDELDRFLASGTLTRLDLAFSRESDGPKQYVQHRMRENAAELFAWLEDGAYLYVCGDADRMAKDVDVTLHDIVAEAGAVDAAGAHAYVNQLIKSHRYVRDVY